MSIHEQAQHALMRLVPEISLERARQIRLFGDQSHRPSYTDGARAFVLSATQARANLEDAVANGELSWAHIFIEEACEALDEAEREDIANLRKELIQVVAVCAAWIQKLDEEADGVEVNCRACVHSFMEPDAGLFCHVDGGFGKAVWRHGEHCYGGRSFKQDPLKNTDGSLKK